MTVKLLKSTYQKRKEVNNSFKLLKWIFLPLLNMFAVAVNRSLIEVVASSNPELRFLAMQGRIFRFFYDHIPLT